MNAIRPVTAVVLLNTFGLLALAACNSTPPADTTPPAVSSTTPADHATGAPTNTAISATFSEPMAASSIAPSTFTLTQGGAFVTGNVTYSGTTATFTPAQALAGETPYTATITTGATDVAGNALAAAHSWTFTTGAAADTTPPSVTSTVPSNDATGVAVNSAITAAFSEPMNASTLTATTFTVARGGTQIAGTVSYSGTTATFAPSSALAYTTPYTATITRGAKDLAGNPLAASYSWTFTTGPAPDTTPPTVSATSPLNNAMDVAIGTAVTATFSEPMDASTLTAATFTLTPPVAGTVSYGGTTATFTPSSALAYSTTYTATLAAGAKDLAGNALASSYSWMFTTGPAPDTTPPTVSATSPANNATGVALGAAVTATFSEPMDASTLTDATFTLAHGATQIAGTVSYSGTTATFTPSSALAYATAYTATLTPGAKDLAGNALASSYAWTFTTTAVIPLDGNWTGKVSNNSSLPYDFTVKNTGTAINPLTMTYNTCGTTTQTVTSDISISNGGFSISLGGVCPSAYTSGTFSTPTHASGTIGLTYTYIPNVCPCSGSATLSWTACIADCAGRVCGSDGCNGSCGSCGAGRSCDPDGQCQDDSVPPTVAATDPTSGQTAVPVGATVKAAFSEAMDPASLNATTFTLAGPGPVTGAVAYDGTYATFTPSSSLAYLTTYTATIGTGARDTAQNSMAAPYTWSFTTGPDTTPPAVSSHSPTGARAPIDGAVTVTFSEPMDPATINGTTFTLLAGAMAVPATVSYAGLTATLTPASSLAYSTAYTATVTTGARDLAGNALAANHVWSFTTAPFFADSFEAGGWATLLVAGTSGNWTMVSQGFLGTPSPHDGALMAEFGAFMASSGAQVRLYRTTGVAIPSGYTTVTLSFWMYHDTSYSTANDQVQAQLSADGTTWTNVGPLLSRYSPTAYWEQVSIDVSGYRGQTVRVGFLGISAWGWNEDIDEVTMDGT